MEKPIQGSSMVPYLPPEVIIEILVKCPVKTLLRFRVVCKLWCSLISSRQFIRRHLSKCARSTQRMILNHLDVLYDLNFYPVDNSMVLEETSIGQIGDHRICCIMGSCDGLICLKDNFTGKMLVWNPSTRGIKMLPSPSKLGVVHNEAGKYKEWRFGFGHDCNNDNYKVVIFVPRNPKTSDDDCSYKSIMHTLGTNSWRRIQDSPLGIHFDDKNSTFVSGALHWKAIVPRSYTGTDSKYSAVIASFDLTSETYMDVPLPQNVGVSSRLEEVGASKGCLCLLASDTNDGRYNIWVMEEYGVQESWTQTVKIPCMLDGIHYIKMIPMTWLVENGEILLNLEGKQASYNPNRNTVRYFATENEDRVRYPVCVGYEESLVSPNSNVVSNGTCGLSIKIGRTMRKEEKAIDVIMHDKSMLEALGLFLGNGEGGTRFCQTEEQGSEG